MSSMFETIRPCRAHDPVVRLDSRPRRLAARRDVDDFDGLIGEQVEVQHHAARNSNRRRGDAELTATDLAVIQELVNNPSGRGAGNGEAQSLRRRNDGRVDSDDASRANRRAGRRCCRG